MDVKGEPRMATEYRVSSMGLRTAIGRRAGEPLDARIAVMIAVGKREKLEEVRLTEDEALQYARDLLSAVMSVRRGA